MIESVCSGAIGTAGPGGVGLPVGLPAGLLTPAAVAGALAQLCSEADTHRRGFGAGPVNEMVAGLATAVGDAPVADREFGVAVVVELTRRYLEAVRGHGRGRSVPQVWQVVLDAWAAPDARPERVALAGAYALAGHDIPPAAVSTCTLLGRTPGSVERGDLQTVVDLLAGLASAAARRDPDPVTAQDAGELEYLLSRGGCWLQVKHLWTVRGRPTEAEKDGNALDWRAAQVARGLLGTPASR